MIDRCVELGLRKPEFRQDEDFMVTLWRKEVVQAGASDVSSVPSSVLSNVLSRDYVEIKLGLSWDKVENVLMVMSKPTSAGELMQVARHTFARRRHPGEEPFFSGVFFVSIR